MNLLKISFKNTFYRPLGAALSILLMALGIMLIALMLWFDGQISRQLERNQQGIDLVIGAKGSPLQLILSAIYQVDNPTGNIQLKDVQAFMNPKHPLIARAIPLSMGDSYRDFRVVGTTEGYLELYHARLAEGSLFKAPFEVVVGAQVAASLGVRLGDTFKSAHGLAGAFDEHAHLMRVVGILKPSQSVVDQLIVCNLETIWENHAEHGEVSDTTSADSLQGARAITSLLLQYKNKTDLRALNMPRYINEKTSMMAAAPAYQTARLFELMGFGEYALRLVAYTIVIVSALSIFISLFNALRERRHEIALLRVLGASRLKVTVMLLLEGLILSVVGYVLGIALSLGLRSLLAHYMQNDYKYQLSVWMYSPDDAKLLLFALGIGLVGAVVPAMLSYRTSISSTLSKD
jgi:putative ABC transport system permease protein